LPYRCISVFVVSPGVTGEAQVIGPSCGGAVWANAGAASRTSVVTATVRIIGMQFQSENQDCKATREVGSAQFPAIASAAKQ
jgi:hypothetical protein